MNSNALRYIYLYIYNIKKMNSNALRCIYINTIIFLSYIYFHIILAD